MSKISRRDFLNLAGAGAAWVFLPGGCGLKSGGYEGIARRVFLVGLDGFCWQVMTPLLQNGELPNLSRLINEGTSGELATIIPTVSPIIWTSIATGKNPHKHGIKGIWRRSQSNDTTRSPAEELQIKQLKALGYIGGSDSPNDARMVLYESTLRRAKALWNILSEKHLYSYVLGWWTTYPAEQIYGQMVSDRYLFNHLRLKSQINKELIYDTKRALVFPPELEASVQSVIMRVEDVSKADMQQFIDGAVDLTGPLSLHDREDELRIAYAKDESIIRMSLMMLEEKVPELLMVYIQGTDIVSHYFWKYRFPDQWVTKYPNEPVAEKKYRRYSQTINEYYKLQDRHLGELLNYADDKTVVIVCSDHGFVTGKRSASRHPLAATTISGVHHPYAPPGVIIMSGCGIKKGSRIRGAHVYDITPTILTLLGLPVGADMDGKVLTAFVGKSAASPGFNVKYIKTYESENK